MEIARMTKGSWGKIVAFFDLKIQGMTIKGWKLISGNDGLFVGVPSIKKEDDSYDNIVIIDKDVIVNLQDIANKHYDEN